MNFIGTAVLLAGLMYAADAVAQTNMFPGSQISVTQSVHIASQLYRGMDEDEADALMRTNGLTGGFALGCSHGWTRFYRLTNNCNLCLVIRPSRFHADGAWADGKVEKVYVESNSVTIIPEISLRSHGLRQGEPRQSAAPLRPAPQKEPEKGAR